jgi:hypothetical protein
MATYQRPLPLYPPWRAAPIAALLSGARGYFPPEGGAALGRRAADAGARPGSGRAPFAHAASMSRRRGSLPCWFGRWSLKRMNKEGATILLVEQSLDVALARASYVYIVDPGRDVRREGTTKAMRDRTPPGVVSMAATTRSIQCGAIRPFPIGLMKALCATSPLSATAARRFGGSSPKSLPNSVVRKVRGRPAFE